MCSQGEGRKEPTRMQAGHRSSASSGVSAEGMVMGTGWPTALQSGGSMGTGEELGAQVRNWAASGVRRAFEFQFSYQVRC